MNHPLVCKPSIIFLLTIRFLNPFFSAVKLPEVWVSGNTKNFYIPLYYSFCPCICNIVSSIGCCYCIIIQLSFLLNIFLFRGCKYHTDMLYKFVFNILCYSFDSPTKNSFEGIELEFSWTSEFCVSYNIYSWWTTHWRVNHFFVF